MEKVTTEELKKALQYLEIDVPETLEKGMKQETLEGSEQNGGGSEQNDLDKKKADLKSRIEKAKKDLEDLEKEESELKKGDEKEDLEEKEEKIEEEKEEKIEKSRSSEKLEETVSHLVTIVKSQNQNIDILTGKMEEFLSSPQERRSAANVETLKKSLGYEELDGKEKEEKNSNSMSIMEKGRVSSALMGVYEEGGCKDEGLANAIMTYESSGFLAKPVIDLMKSKGIEIIK